MRRSADQLLKWLRSSARHSYKERDVYYCDDDENEWSINGQPIPADRRDDIFAWIDSQLRQRRNCPFCRTTLAVEAAIEHEDDTGDSPVISSAELHQESDHGLFVEYTLALCPKCWYWHWFSGGTLGRICAWDAAVAKIRSFDPGPPSGCMQELAIWLRQDPNRWNAMDPTKLEKFVAEIWRQNFAHAEVLHVGRPADGGVDVLFIDSERKQWLIQVKRRSDPEKGESSTTLRNLLGSMQLHPTSFGVVVSTADHFTHHALAARERAQSLGMTLELVDRGRLDRMLEGFHPAFPWMDFIDEHYPHVSQHFVKKGFGRL